MYQHRFHIMPPNGWLNDPNGSSYYRGQYHIFFQYSEDVNGGLKSWGHFISDDLVEFNYLGIAIRPDSPRDLGGAYSGTAYIDGDNLELYYTGNVKRKGNYDYINEGREHNCLRVISDDGINFYNKECLLTNADYPKNMSCHVRDPKIYIANGKFYMLLGARTKDSRAAFLLYESLDRNNWKLLRSYISSDNFGYMWECPDYFELNGYKVFSFCPQGLASQPDRFQNIYQSGYVVSKELDLANNQDAKLDEIITLDNFVEWDYGFDFYAPQTFTGKNGKTYLLGWAGMPDAKYHNEPAIKEGWQHSMTLVRELRIFNGQIYQKPVDTIEKYRHEHINSDKLDACGLYWNLEVDIEKNECDIDFNKDLNLRYEDERLILEFLNNSGCGRGI